MGSSKKHKDKDRKKRKRERSTSRSRDRKEKHRHRKHKKHKRAREERTPSISLSDISDIESDYDNVKEQPTLSSNTHPPPSQPPPSHQSKAPEVANGDAKSGNEISLSIDETNRIRAKLGLKPLSGSGAPDKTVETEVNSTKVEDGQEFVHKPAENLRDKLEVEKLREKIAAQREKRKQLDRMAKVKGLGEADSDEEGAAAWINKSRKIEKLKKEAAKKDKMLDDLDAQFGIGELVEAEVSSQKKKMYDSGNLSGLKVQHDIEKFADGNTTILTLKDSSILDGEEDTLVNVNIEDVERVEKNLKLKRTKLNDVDYDAPEVDEFGLIVQKDVLTKYDEEIGGERKKSFRIGSGGDRIVIPDQVNKLSKMSKLRQLTSLNAPEHQLATEYMTQEEMSFKKVKKKRKKKKMLTADDLVPLDDSEQHLGSRGTIKIKEEGEVTEDNPIPTPNQRVKSLRELTEEDDEAKTETNDVVMEEEPDSEGENDSIELQEALARSRRAKLKANRMPKKVEDPIANLSQISSGKQDLNSMTLNLTDEFCRSLGDIPTYGLSGNRAEDDAVMEPGAPPTVVKEAHENRSAWAEVVDVENIQVEIETEKSAPILEEEPDTTRGIGNALQLAMKKGYFEKCDNKKLSNAALNHLQAKNYSIDDKAGDDDRRSGRGGGAERYMGPIMDFREKDYYKPDVKLDYVDDEGRKLNAKEAFRYLSHKFHGKGSGKNKLEKRMKKWQEESLMKAMSSSDTPLQTLEKQREKQKQMGSAYLVISGHVSQDNITVKK